MMVGGMWVKLSSFEQSLNLQGNPPTHNAGTGMARVG